MNQTEKQILKVLQSNFPLVKNPYQVLSRRFGISQKQLLSKVKSFKDKSIIRRIGAVISSGHLGYKSVLIATRVKKKHINKTALFINSFINVSHNYLRNAEYNIWFTFSAKTKKEINDFIKMLKKRSAVEEVLVLPAQETFKIKAEFKF